MSSLRNSIMIINAKFDQKYDFILNFIQFDLLYLSLIIGDYLFHYFKLLNFYKILMSISHLILKNFMFMPITIY